MSKKLLIYGLAFGSAAAALSYIYMNYVAIRPEPWMHLVSILGEFLIIPGTAIYLFLRSMKQNDPAGFTLGKGIFLGFFLSVIIASSVSLFYSYMSQFNPEIINGFIDRKIAMLKSNPKFMALAADEIEKNIQAVRDSYSVGGQFKYQLYLGAARGLFLSAIIAFFLKARTSAS